MSASSSSAEAKSAEAKLSRNDELFLRDLKRDPERKRKIQMFREMKQLLEGKADDVAILFDDTAQFDPRDPNKSMRRVTPAELQPRVSARVLVCWMFGQARALAETSSAFNYIFNVHKDKKPIGALEVEAIPIVLRVAIRAGHSESL
jgi:hypothetical protein